VIDACSVVGRDPASMTFSAALVVAVGRDEDEFIRRASAIGREPDELRKDGIAGVRDDVAVALQRWQDAGADRIYLQVLDLADLDHLDTIAAASVV
jgi:alkanesulfonate monooxygenase SsuD/methylene tetrahydromethanopterin reductase-like flavin-dependent oxidoreductase (luciferase family)